VTREYANEPCCQQCFCVAAGENRFSESKVRFSICGMTRPTRAAVTLTSEERSTLRNWAHSRVSSQAVALRARIVLACEEEPTDRVVAERLGVSPQLVGRWRSRFQCERLAGLGDRPRSGRPRAATGAQRDQVVLRLLDDPPASVGRWSSRSLAAATGMSQSSVSRILRSLDPGGVPPDWFPGRERTIGGVLLAPCARALAVVLAEDERFERGAAGTGHRSDAALVLSAADALSGERRPHSPRGDVSHFLTFLGRLHQAVPPTAETHVLVDSAAVLSDPRVARRLRGHSRCHVHAVAAGRPWAADAVALLGSRTLDPDFRGSVRSWVADRSTPLLWVPGPAARNHGTSGSLTGSSHLSAIAGADPADTPGQGSPRLVDRVAHALREQIAGGHFPPGERIKEAPLAARLGLSRGPVREALRLLAEDGLVEMMPNRGTTIPMVTAERVMEVYAVRAALGVVLLRRLASLEVESLRPVSEALSDIRRVARQRDHFDIGDADLRFQDAIARAAGLRHTSQFFLRLTMQLRMFISILKLDYASIPDRIERRDSAIFRALCHRDGHKAVQAWRAKMEVAVRYMVAQLPAGNFDPDLWLTISGVTDR
jgi:DNA-binding GntR family transcriptional regulator/transposase